MAPSLNRCCLTATEHCPRELWNSVVYTRSVYRFSSRTLVYSISTYIKLFTTKVFPCTTHIISSTTLVYKLPMPMNLLVLLDQWTYFQIRGFWLKTIDCIKQKKISGYCRATAYDTFVTQFPVSQNGLYVRHTAVEEQKWRWWFCKDNRCRPKPSPHPNSNCSARRDENLHTPFNDEDYQVYSWESQVPSPSKGWSGKPTFINNESKHPVIYGNRDDASARAGSPSKISSETNSHNQPSVSGECYIKEPRPEHTFIKIQCKHPSMFRNLSEVYMQKRKSRFYVHQRKIGPILQCVEVQRLVLCRVPHPGSSSSGRPEHVFIMYKSKKYLDIPQFTGIEKELACNGPRQPNFPLQDNSETNKHILQPTKIEMKASYKG